MKKELTRIIIIASITCISGFIALLIVQQRLIINWSSFQNGNPQTFEKQIVKRKTVNLYYFNHKNITKMPIELLWSEHNLQETITTLIGTWIALLQDEKLMSRYVSLESVAYAPLSQEVIISFSQTPFEPHWSIFEKWHCIESLNKTIQTSGLPVSYLIFLVNNRYLEDDHLDFSQPWPVDGFTTQSSSDA